MKKKRPFPLYLLCLLHLLLSVSALAAGYSFITDPDGSGLGINLSYLNRTPFNSFFLPGLILFVFNGLFPLFIFIGLLFQPQWKLAGMLNIYAEKHWSWTYSLYSGIVLITWIAVQITMVEYFILQPVCIGIGLIILILTLLPSIQKYFSQD